MKVFKETQKLRQLWVLALIISADLIAGGLLLKEMFGGDQNQPLLALVLLPFIFLNWMIFNMRLEIEIKNQTIYYRLIPFHLSFRKIRKQEIVSFEVVSYHPIEEYGGWGIRGFMRKNKAVNLYGNKGLKLHLKNGKSLLLGTQKPALIEEAMEELMKNQY